MEKKERSPYLQCGQIINTHGVRGAVKARSDCDSPEILASLRRVYTERGGSFTPYEVRGASVLKGFVLLTLEGVDDLDAAVRLKGRNIYAERDELSEFLGEGDRFIADLLGLPLVDADTGDVLGVLTDVINRGAQDIYVVETPNGERMMPAVPEFVISITDEAITVRPIPGMLD